MATTQDTPDLSHLSADPDMLKYELRRRRKIEYAPTRHAKMLARTDSEGRPLYRLTEGGNVVRTRPIKEHMKRRILARDGHACVECGTTRNLEVAHIEPYRVNGNNSDENMRTLCASCHAAEEAGNG